MQPRPTAIPFTLNNTGDCQAVRILYLLVIFMHLYPLQLPLKSDSSSLSTPKRTLFINAL